MACSRSRAVLAIVAVTVVALAASANAVTTTITLEGGGRDGWNTAANWDNGVPSGTIDAVVGAGILADVDNASTPIYSGTLTLNNNSTLRCGWTGKHNPEDAIPLTSATTVTMNAGTQIQTRNPFTVNVPPITMAGDGTFWLSPSTEAHHKTRNFGAISGPGALTMVGNNNSTANLDAASTFSGGFIADALSSWRVEANVSGAFGTGDVTFNGQPGVPSRGATLIIDVPDVIADTATLSLNDGRDHREAAKLILNASETVLGFSLDGVPMAPGSYDSTSGLLTPNGDPVISGSGILTVTGPLGPPEPTPLKVDFNSTNQEGGPHNQAGYQPYDAAHEQAATFDTKTYSAFTTTVSVTPEWPNTTDRRVQQMSDRGGGNDAYWDNADGDIDLVTDWLGIDSRTNNGGNGNWDGTTGTPTYMTLALGGLPAGMYDWKSFHHDTEHVHGDFTVDISTDGGFTWEELLDGLMTDSTPGGNPDSSGFTPPGPWPGPMDQLPSVYEMSFMADGTNDVLIRFAPLSNTAVHRQLWGINGFELWQADADVIPEPATLSLLGLGALLALRRRRRRR